MTKNGFFTIERLGLETGNESLMYFNGFKNEFHEKLSTEIYGIEAWTEIEKESLAFDTYTEAKNYLEVIEKDLENYEYMITLKRFATEDDMKERKDLCGDMITLKIFYTTQQK